jgi:hypothetical protein
MSIFHEYGNRAYCRQIIRMLNSRRMKLAEYIARMGEKRNACKVLMGKPEGKRPLGRPRHMWEGNIKVDCREIV